MDKTNELGRNMDCQDPDYVQENKNPDSTEEDESDTEVETIVLKAVNTIFKSSLKRTRRPSKLQKPKRTKVVRDRRQGRQVVDKDVSIPKSRYNGGYLVNIMKDFDDNQRQYLRDIDFGAILDLDDGFVPWSFVQWICDHVDVKKEEIAFHHKSIGISIESFGQVLGIPTKGIPVPTDSKVTTMEFLQLFGLTEMPSIKFFGDKIIKKGQSKDEFIRCFMTVALSSFYCPTSSTKPSTAYLAGLIHVDKIKTYNWGKYFHQWTLWYINKYQTCSSTLAVCNFYMAVRYLDFLDFGSVQLQYTLPRISFWKGDMIKEYIKLDMDDDNYYGKLPIKHILDTCYGEASLINTNSGAYSVEHLRQSIDSFQHSAFSDKVKDNICSLFEDFTQDETAINCSKVQGLLISVLECLLQNNCITINSQSTEKVNFSSEGENKSSGTKNASDNTLKLPSSDTSTNLEGKQDRYCGSQHSHSSVPLAKNQEQLSLNDKVSLAENNIFREGGEIASTDQIIARIAEPIDDNTQIKIRNPPITVNVVDHNQSDERIHNVNTALCNLDIRENRQQTDFESHEQSCANSASLEYMLNKDQDDEGGHCDGHASRGQKHVPLNSRQHQDEQITPPGPTHAMFGGIHNMGKSCSDSIIEKSTSFVNSSSIKCGKKSHTTDKEIMYSTNLNMFSAYSNNHDLSSATRIQSYCSTETAKGLDDMTIDDFEIEDGVPSTPFMDRWLASPRNQANRSAKITTLEQQKAMVNHDDELQLNPLPQLSNNDDALVSPLRVNSIVSPTSPQRANSVGSPASPARNAEMDTVIISSQESPEVVFVRQIQSSPSRNSHDTDEDVYIGEHRLTPIRRKTSEAIDTMYDNINSSNKLPLATSSVTSEFTQALPPRRMVVPSRYVSSPYDVNIRSFAPTPKEVEYYHAIVRLANMDEIRFKMAIQIGNCRVSFETFGNSLKPGGLVDSWVINLYCRILLKKNHPKESNRHTFFHTSSEYFLEKWETEERRLYLKDLTMKAFDGAGKAKKLHLTDSLHFPSLYNFHWFLFTVDIRDKKFMFMDSYFNKDSVLHKEVDDKMIRNFIAIWNECGLKNIEFGDFEVIYPRVPKQDNGKDCGIHLIKNIEFFKLRSTLMGTYSHEDVPNICIQIANDMMFCQYNEKEEMQEAVREFKPAVHGKYARMM